MDDLALLDRLLMAAGPPGHEHEVRMVFHEMAADLGVEGRTDEKGNWLFGPEDADVAVCAHLDEIALVVRRVEEDGHVRVGPLGGLHPWKFGESSVQIMVGADRIPGVFGFGGIHTEDSGAASVKARSETPTWEDGWVTTGLSAAELRARGVRPGRRVVLGPERRGVTLLGGDLVAGHFLDDRADLLAMLLHFADGGPRENVLYAATVGEEVGGEGALWLLDRVRPVVCVALELAPLVPDAPIRLCPTPAVWVTDGYAAMTAADGDLIEDLGVEVQWQSLSRGGSDASCAASRGFVARPITLGIPMENSHGLEIMHREGPARLAELTSALLDSDGLAD